MNGVFTISLIFLWILVFLNLALTLGLSKRINSIFTNFIKMESLNVGEAMPIFETKAIDGTLITSRSFTGKYTAIVFLSPECTSCVQDFPKIVALGHEIADSEFKLILVSIGELKATQHLLGNQIPDFPVVNASFEDLFISKLKAYSTPSYYLFSKSGKLEKAGSEVRHLEMEIKQLGFGVLQEVKL